MNTPLTKFAFIDSVHAAEILHVTQDTILDWVADGRLRPFGGKPTNPFVRSSDVANLLEELGITADEPPKRTKSASAKVQTRLTADSRWSDISDTEIADWASRADVSRRQAARVAATNAIARLSTLLSVLDELQ